MSRRILVLFAHPAFQKSRINRALVGAINTLEGVTFHDLYEVYPTLLIDVRREQDLLRAHDVIVFHHPFYWYSSPALLKEWQDVVLEHGFAFGEKGTALHGKIIFSAITTGGPCEAYCREGYNRFSIRELLVPFEQTARLCGMTWLPPFLVFSGFQLTDAEIAGAATDYRTTLESLRDGTTELETAQQAACLNDLVPHAS